MAIPYRAYAATAGQQDFDVPFPYINRDHVKVRVNGIEQTPQSWPSDTRVRLSSGAAAGDFVEVIRDTPIEVALVKYQDGNILTSEDLNLGLLQTLYKQQELSAAYEREIEAAKARLAAAGGVEVDTETLWDQVVTTLAEGATTQSFLQRMSEVETNAESILQVAVEAEKARTGIHVEQTVRENEVEALAQQITVVNAEIANNQALVVSEQIARATADAALAEDITLVQTTVGQNTASVATLQSSISGLEARYGVLLDVNGYVTGFTQNNDGQSGSFTILADQFRIVDPDGGSEQTPVVPFEVSDGTVKVNGNLIVTGSINSNQLAANSVTQNNAAFTDASLSVGTSWTEVQSVDLTTTGGDVRVDFCGAYSALSATAGSVLYRIKRGTTVVREGTFVTLFGQQLVSVEDSETFETIGTANVPAPVAGTYSIFAVDTSAPVGTHTYSIELQSTSTGGSIKSRQMGLIELKR